MRSGEPSLTARRVAALRLDFPRVPARKGDPEADRRLSADVAGTLPREVAGAGTRRSAPDRPMARYLALRTAFFDRVVVSALEDGIDQVVTTAAGYDGRALRYGRPGVRWFELDHPDTQADKRRRLARLGIETPGVTWVPLDLSCTSAEVALSTAGHDRGSRSLVLCEGLAVYLEEEAFAGLLGSLRRATSSDSMLAVSLSSLGAVPEDDPRRRAFAAAVEEMGEPAITFLGPAEGVALLRRVGWRPIDQRAVPPGATAPTPGEARHGLMAAEPD